MFSINMAVLSKMCYGNTRGE
uniref:Uncharacterized protein n=1 Tax=Anguilla anguilla TaxID=7936 RepID=A0A0E9VIU3_ANGAN